MKRITQRKLKFQNDTTKNIVIVDYIETFDLFSNTIITSNDWGKTIPKGTWILIHNT